MTVVVPAYNVERYLPACLASLRAQTAWQDCVVVVIDDGSTDATAQIAAAAAEQEPRITLVRQPNSGPGPGAARNHGLDLVDTEFVVFCDGDDELTPAAVELLRAGLTEFDLDLAVGASEQFPEARSWLWTPYFRAGTLTCVDIEDVPLLAHNAQTGNKMFRTAALRSSGRRFAEGIHHQDTVVTVPSLVTSTRLALVGDVVHRYRKRPEGGSIMDAHFTRLANFWDHLQVIETLGVQLDGLSPARRPLMEAFVARSFQGFAWRAPEVLPAERIEEFFGRTRAVVQHLSTEAIATATRHAGERAAYVAMLEDDLPTYRRLGWHLDHLVAHDGDLYLDVPTRSEAHRALLRTGETRAWAQSLAVSSRSVGFDLSVRVRGARSLAHGVDATVLRLQPVDGDSTVGCDVALRPGQGTEALGQVEIPRSRLASGRYLIRLRFVTRTGRTARWVRRPRLRSADGAVAVGAEDVRAPWSLRRYRLTELDGRALLVVP